MNLNKVSSDILSNRANVAYYVLDEDTWNKVAREAYEEGEFNANPLINARHFMIYGVPVMLGGHA